MQTIAADYGGKCLSKEYIARDAPLKWMCEKGHTWESLYTIVQQGGWCQSCSKSQSDQAKLNEIRVLAKENNIFCLTEKYVNYETPFKFKCKKGHLFEKTIKEYKRRPICYTCYWENIRLEGERKMLEIAAQQKGKLLSRYEQAAIPLQWQCRKGHKWKATASNISRGRWCPVCGQAAGNEKQRKSIKEIQDFAAGKGGKLISKKYVNHKSRLEWQCEKGHRWISPLARIIYKNSWCRICSGVSRRSSIKDFQKLAKEHKGTLLSKEYSGYKIPLNWQCQKGHIWETAPANITKGSWCPECGRQSANEKIRIKIGDLQKLAQERGGRLLSKKYDGNKTPLKWQCEQGHVWLCTLPSIKLGGWCRECHFNSRRASIEEFRQLAKDRGGKLLSKQYINAGTRLEWQCDKGHKWLTLPGAVKRGTWCRKCSNKLRAERLKYTISELQHYAKSRGGKLLSDKYIDSRHHLKWECAKGHSWLAMTGAVMNKQSWCGKCAKENLRSGIKKYQKLAESHGGKLLSKNYSNNQTPLKWQCKNGHIWHTSAKVIDRKGWCVLCAREDKKAVAFNELQKLAKNKKGKLLSQIYLGSDSHLKWECAKGHHWKAVPSEIKRGSWCPVCARKNK